MGADISIIQNPSWKVISHRDKNTGNPKKGMINFEKLRVLGNIGFGTLIFLNDKPRLLNHSDNATPTWDI
jgi:hypothetical protein